MVHRPAMGCMLCDSITLIAPPRGRLGWGVHRLCLSCGLMQAPDFEPAPRTPLDAATLAMIGAPPTARQQLRAEQIVAAVAALPVAPRRVLDIGCGDGTIAELVAARTRATIDGVEPVPEFRAAAAARMRRTVEHTAELPATERYDVVVLARVLSAVFDPVALLEEAGRRLAPGGHVYLDEANLLAPDRRKRLSQWLSDKVRFAASQTHLIEMVRRAGLVEEDVIVENEAIRITARAAPKNGVQPQHLEPSKRLAFRVVRALVAHEAEYWPAFVTRRVRARR